MRRLLIVAGSDSGGGAGIQADIKTATAHGVYAMTAITAITVQDTNGVHGVHLIPDATIADQMRVVLADIGTDAVKTGMLHSAGTIAAVAAEIARGAGEAPLVVDPVMVAKGGARLIDDTAIAAMKKLLLPQATLLTPNAPEAAALLGGAELTTQRDLIVAGRGLRGLGAKAVLMKGGHLAGDMVFDALISEEGEEVFASPRLRTAHTHGTGCTLASAIASNLALGRPLKDAVKAARSYVQQAIAAAPGLGHGHGPLNHMVKA
ncbi:MAG: bifunctional hydroxymethylpyrimidine kinase/phosphomethylpyrimidine kinase [Alphaproteobacteria bacterium]|nr:bifunctional hydroxymethylpyrimidine kinase/phosphomethylpyrimidine kinase [Alphaproteobacteria bacterium]